MRLMTPSASGDAEQPRLAGCPPAGAASPCRPRPCRSPCGPAARGTSAFLSKPAAMPTGLVRSSPQSVVRSSGGSAWSCSGARPSRSALMVAPCAISGSMRSSASRVSAWSSGERNSGDRPREDHPHPLRQFAAAVGGDRDRGASRPPRDMGSVRVEVGKQLRRRARLPAQRRAQRRRCAPPAARGRPAPRKCSAQGFASCARGREVDVAIVEVDRHAGEGAGAARRGDECRGCCDLVDEFGVAHVAVVMRLRQRVAAEPSQGPRATQGGKCLYSAATWDADV